MKLLFSSSSSSSSSSTTSFVVLSCCSAAAWMVLGAEASPSLSGEAASAVSEPNNRLPTFRLPATRSLQTLGGLGEFEDDQPWPTGTAVYYLSEGDWYAGTVTNYFDGVYTITWEEGNELEYFDNPDVIDEMVSNAQIKPPDQDLFAMATPIMATDGSNRQGTIVDFQNGRYRIEWQDDGSVDAFAPGQAVDDMVNAASSASQTDPATPTPTEAATVQATQAATQADTEADTEADTMEDTTEMPTDADTTLAPTEDDTEADTEADTTLAPTEAETEADTVAATEDGTRYVPWGPGTEVHKFFQDDRWYWGTITWFSEEGIYSIEWDDGSVETYDNTDEVDAMVQAATVANKGDGVVPEPWNNGIAVYQKYPTGSGGGGGAYDGYFGEIIGYSQGEYTVRWSDDTVASYAVEATNQMVQRAYDVVMAEQQQAAFEQQQQQEQQPTEDQELQQNQQEAAPDTSALNKNDGGNMTASSGGKFGVSFVVLALVVAGCYCFRRSRTGIDKNNQNYRSPFSRNLAPSSYKDEPESDAAAEVPDII